MIMKKSIIALLLLVAIAGKGQESKRETRIKPAIFLCTDTSGVRANAFAKKGFVEQEKHNTAEGVMDAEFTKCIGDDGKEVPCYVDYWVTVKYLGPDKKPLSQAFIIWQVK